MRPIHNQSASPENYQHWELMVPELSPRSVLYQIRPIGIGTTETECLTSYLARLANAHHLPVGQLLRWQLIPMINDGRTESGRLLNCFTLFKMCSANGADALALDLVGAIERLTLIKGISPTTFVIWSNVLSRRELLRPFRAWCPCCYAHQATEEGPLYDPLLWTVIPVKVCPRHQIPLQETCPACKKRIQPVLNLYLPGFCSYCHCWLGKLDREPATDEGVAVIEDLDYELWAADNIGKIIAASPTLSATPARQNVIAAVDHCCNLLMEGNSRMLSRLLDTPKSTSRNWLQGRTIPALKTLVRLSYLTKVPLLGMLTEPASVVAYISEHPIEIGESQAKQIRCLHRQHPLACQKVREYMEAALIEMPSPSLAEVARRLGYQHPSTLRVKFPELSKQIVANHRSSEEFLRNQQSKRNKGVHRPDRESQKRLLELELTQSCPATLRDLAHRLGYADTCTICTRFPDLSRSLVKKRRDYQQRLLAKRLSRCLNVLETALVEDPPLTLVSVAKRLAGISMSFLREHFPEQCRNVSVRHLDYQKRRMQDAGERLRQSLQENPPQPLSQLSKEIGYHFSTLMNNYPELCHPISARYKSYTRSLAAEKKKAISADQSLEA
jgi:AraC-like DNA-binding protein